MAISCFIRVLFCYADKSDELCRIYISIMKVFELIKLGIRAASDFILPRVCVVCGERLLMKEHVICLHCLADLPLTHFWKQKHNPMADRFNAVIQHGLEEAWDGKEWTINCLQKDGTREVYAFAASLFFYNHDARYRHILYRLKYEGQTDVGRYFGKMLGAKLTLSSAFKDVDYVMPVPLHWTRKWKRGYNQAEIIAREVADALGIPMSRGILYRRRKTQTQTKLDIKGKANNVAKAFDVRVSERNCPKMKHILLIDDVFTSGATLHSCFVALRTIFPPSVRISVATLAFVGGV